MKSILKILPVSAALLCAVLIASCSKDGVNQADLALQTAKAYYDQLTAGDIDAFLDGTLKGDTVPEDYKAQLRLNVQMFVEQQQKAHNGLSSVQAVRATCDTIRINPDSLLVTAESILVLCYGDSTREEVVVPMIRKNDIWYMR